MAKMACDNWRLGFSSASQASQTLKMRGRKLTSIMKPSLPSEANYHLRKDSLFLVIMFLTAMYTCPLGVMAKYQPEALFL